MRLGAATIAALLAVGCGGASGPPTGPDPGDPTKIVTLDEGNFDALVVASSRPSLVEFHNPT